MHPWYIAVNAVALLLYMSAGFALAYKRGRLDTVDAMWGGGYVVAGWLMVGVSNFNGRSILIAGLIFVWSTRLTSHIIERSRKRGADDPRYTQIATKWGKQNYWQRAYLSIFLLQGLLILIVSLPTVFATAKSISLAPLLTIVGLLVWVVGFAVETLGDRQLRAFLSNKSNKGKVLDSGLWHYTRHPNYLGEITQWYGIGIIACGARYGWIGLAGPLVLNVLIRFVSGVPPIEKRKSKDPSYQTYMQHTGAILPKFR